MTQGNGSGSGWRVTGQAQVTDVGDDARFVEGMRVAFTTGAGHSGSVFLPLTAFTPDNVRAAIDARAQTMDAIAALAADGG